MARPPTSRSEKMIIPTTKPEVAHEDKRSREELLAELEYLRMENAYLKKLEALTQGHAPKRRKPSRR